MEINIHWGEFVGPANRTEVKKRGAGREMGNLDMLYKYEVDLRGYVPFALFKDMQTKQWLSQEVMNPTISKQVIFYTKKIVDDYENKFHL